MHTRFPIALSLLLVLLMAVPASATPTTVLTDPCSGAPSLQTGLSLPGQDICAVTAETIAAGDGQPTTLQVTMVLAGDPAELPSAHSVAWGSGDCAFIPFRSDRGGLETQGGVAVACGERVDACGQPVPVVCEAEYEFEAVYDAEVVLGPTTVTWTVTFADELEPFAAAHALGSTIVFGTALAGPSWPTFDSPIAAFTCGEITCGEVVGDFVFGSTDYRIG
jgi:hypothetical protein